MKNICSVVAFLLAALFLVACGSTAPAETTSTITPTTTTSVLPDGIRNIVLVIGDGMGDAQIQLGQLASGQNHVFQGWDMIKSNTNSLDTDGNATKTTDSAAGGTALATGQLTVNKVVGRDPSGNDLKNIMEHARDYGKSTGVVTTDAVYGATPASFSSHAADREDSTTIMYSQMRSNIDLLVATHSNDAVEMKAFFTDAGYTYLTDLPSMRKNMDKDKLLCLLRMSGYAPKVSLKDVIPDALDYLDQDTDGFMLMVEQAHIDKYCHNNEIAGTQACVNMLDDCVSAIVDWVGDREDTAIIITADHETGGLALSTDPVYEMEYAAPSGSNIYYRYSSTSHTPTPVSIYTHGFTPDWSPYYLDDTGTIVKNTAVFHIMYGLLENPMQ